MLERTNQTGEFQATVHHSMRVRQAVPAPKRQRRDEVEIVLIDRMEYNLRDREQAGTAPRFHKEFAIANHDSRKQVVSDDAHLKPLLYLDNLGFVQANNTDPFHDLSLSSTIQRHSSALLKIQIALK